MTVKLEPLTLEVLPLVRMREILDKAVRRAALADAEACWELLGAGADKDGYPVVIRVVNGRRRRLRLNRISVALAEGIAYADVDQACHSCDNPPCLNPAHLWHGDVSANQRDMVAKGRQARVAQHGSISKYTKGCRCEACTAAIRQYQRRRNGSQRELGPRREPEVREEVRRRYMMDGFTQRELAVQVGVPYQTVAKWVLGLRPPRRDGLGRFRNG